MCKLGDVMMKKILLSLTCLLLMGCYPKIGPYNLRYDSVSYNHALQGSNDAQLMLNIVRLRYRDTPTFMHVGIISSAYDFKRSASLDFKFRTGDNTGKLGFDFSEKPTTTYQPLRGKGFVDELLSPISLHTVLLLEHSGWRIDRLLRCCVQRMNNLRKAVSASGPTPDYVPEYEDFLQLNQIFRELEINDAIDIVIQKKPKEDVEYMIVLDLQKVSNVHLERIWHLLELEPGTDHIKLIPFHGQRRAGNEVMIETRSPLSLLYFLSQSVEVPYWEEDCGRVTVTVDAQGNRFDWDEVLHDIMKVRVGQACPHNAKVSVRYRGMDYYIDESDLPSKSTFSLLSQMLALQTGTPTIPVAFTISLND